MNELINSEISKDEYILKKLNECFRLYNSYINWNWRSKEYEITLRWKLREILDRDLGFVAYIIMQTCYLEKVTWVTYEAYSNKYICNEWGCINLKYILNNLNSIIKLYEEYTKPWHPCIRDTIALQITSEEVLKLLQWKVKKENLPKHLIDGLEEIQRQITLLWIDLRN